jgi:hypothetical protein
VGLFGSKRRAGGERSARALALVIEAAAPPEGGSSLGPGSNRPLRILADLGSGRRLHDGKIRTGESHWLVPGMEVEVTFDRDRPGRFEVDWESVPSMEARAAANDASLADPIAARRKVAHALGLHKADTGTARTERFSRAVEQAAAQPAPPGKLRAVVLIATIRGRRRIVGDPENASTHDQVTYRRASAAVLSVNVPGRDPYSVYVQRFKCEVDLLEPQWLPLPALVSGADPAEPQILWAEVPSHDAQLSERFAGSRAAQEARTAQVDTFAQHGQPQQEQMQQLAAESARRALQYVTDPTMRKMLIDQYRAAGIDIGDNP